MLAEAAGARKAGVSAFPRHQALGIYLTRKTVPGHPIPYSSKEMEMNDHQKEILVCALTRETAIMHWTSTHLNFGSLGCLNPHLLLVCWADPPC